MRVLFLSFISFFFISCSNLCINNILKTITSPYGDFIALVFVRDCGATTSFSTQVSIIEKNDKFKNTPGNIFIMNKTENIDIKWIENNILEISYECDPENIFKQEMEYKEIKIEYIYSEPRK